MQFRNSRITAGFLFTLIVSAGVWLNGAATNAFAQPTVPPPAPPAQSPPPSLTPGALPPPPSSPQALIPGVVPPAAATPKLLDLLTWDAIMKEQSPLPGQATADFIFSVTNPSEYNIVIDHVKTSCGCTVAKLPSNPWILTPHTNGDIKVSVNLAGKSGTIFKAITVYSTNSEQKILTVKVNLPENPAVMRMRNQQMAASDAQAIFRGDCAKCHVTPAVGVMGKPLYNAACGICHEARPRASMVPDLHALNHPTDYAFWKQVISEGKPKTMMPGFAISHGGPLNDAQIESLAKVLDQAFPTRMTNQASAVNITNQAGAPGQSQIIRLPPPPGRASTN